MQGWAERERLEAELARAAPSVITLHPGVLADYARKLERLQEAIEQDIREGEPAHAPAIRDLVEYITVRHEAGSPENVGTEITGRLNALLGDKAFPNNVGRIGGSGGYIQYHRSGFRRKWPICSMWSEISTRYTDCGGRPRSTAQDRSARMQARSRQATVQHSLSDFFAHVGAKEVDVGLFDPARFIVGQIRKFPGTRALGQAPVVLSQEAKQIIERPIWHIDN